MTEPKLELNNLKKHFPVNEGFIAKLINRGEPEYVHAVDGVSLEISSGESFGIAGESGCGKTTLGKTAIKLLEPTSGKITFDGRDITDLNGKDLTSFRKEVQIIQQNPYESINKRFRIYDWVKEPLDVHGIGDESAQRKRVLETLDRVGLQPAETYLSEYPSKLSGGERQRVSIARALVLEPSFLLADEPASMLDVSIRASILDLFDELQKDLGLTTLYVSHDLSLLKHMCDRIAIMYLGKIVELGPADKIISNPQHPYTKALVGSMPIIDPDIEREPVNLTGEVPDPIDLPNGCRFYDRCPEATDVCTQGEPQLYNVAESQQARCILFDDEKGVIEE